MSEMRTALGVDFGGVVHGVTYRPGRPDTFLEGSFEEAMGTPAMPGAMQALGRLVEVFEGRVWLVSKCGPRVQALTENWLGRHDFPALTGIGIDHWVFCRQRTDKALRCGELGITHFVDDRADVLEAMEGGVGHRFMFASRGGQAPPGTWRAESWQEVEDQIMSTLSERELTRTTRCAERRRASSSLSQNVRPRIPRLNRGASAPNGTSGNRRRVVCIRRQHEEAAATSAAAVRPALFWSAADVSAGL